MSVNNSTATHGDVTVTVTSVVDAIPRASTRPPPPKTPPVILDCFKKLRAHVKSPGKFMFDQLLCSGSAMGGTLAVQNAPLAAKKCRAALMAALSLTPKASSATHDECKRKKVAFYSIDDKDVLHAPPFAWMLFKGMPATIGIVRPTPLKLDYINPLGLLPFQRDAVDAAIEFVTTLGGCIIIQPCGMGKTEVMAALLAYFGCDAVVVAPKLVLVDQNASKIEQRVPGLSVTKWCGGTRDATGRVIVTTPNSLDSLPPEVKARTQLVIVDEVHGAAARTLFDAMKGFNCARVGVTATLYRSSDGFEKVIPLMFGPVAAMTRRPFSPSVVRVRWCSSDPMPHQMLKDVCKQTNDGREPDARQINTCRWMHNITYLNTQKERNANIMDEVAQCLKRVRQHQPKGRVLVLFDRWHQAITMCDKVGRVSARLKRMAESMEERWENEEEDAQYTPKIEFPEGWVPGPDWEGVKSGVFVGKQKLAEQRLTSDIAEVVFSTMSMAYIGLDLSDIAGIVMVSKSRLMEQAAGRTLRMICMPKCAQFSFIADVSRKAAIRFVEQLRAQLDYMISREHWPLVLHGDDVSSAKIPKRPLTASEALHSLARLRTNAEAWFLSRQPCKRARI